MSKGATGLAFVAGAAIGAAGTWYYLKDKYAKIAEEEIASVKEVYSKREQAVIDNTEKTVVNQAKNVDKKSLMDYAQCLQDSGYTDYSRTVEDKSAKNPGETPYVISPDDFGELDGYTKVSLSYFADGILADECGDIVDDVEEIIGDGLKHFGEYEDDSVFVRNDAKRCDYQILKDLRDFSEFRKNFPPDDDEEV